MSNCAVTGICKASLELGMQWAMVRPQDLLEKACIWIDWGLSGQEGYRNTLVKPVLGGSGMLGFCALFDSRALW